MADGDNLSTEDLERARLTHFAAHRGVPAEEFARISHETPDMLTPYLRPALRPGRQGALTMSEAAEQAQMDPDLLERVWAASGLRDQTHAYDEDVEALRLVTTALQFGFPLDALLQVLRVLSDALGRVSDAMTRAVHLYVHESFRAEGMAGEELLRASQAVADPMVDLVEPAVLYFHRKSWERANREDMLLHLVEDMTPTSTVPGELVRTILFVDLCSFTSLTEEVGDDAAARVVDRFSEIVRRNAATSDGQVIKQIGDEFMLAFPTPAAAVRFGVGMHTSAAAESGFPALRVGAHSGAVLYREGDYVGANVNLAARVTSAAGTGQFVVTPAVRDGAVSADVQFLTLGFQALKGVSDPVELFEVRVDEN
jgi:class 3 adenylate cyclase